jgi:RNA polymerase sigma-70 factor (ECF subfamily)
MSSESMVAEPLSRVAAAPIPETADDELRLLRAGQAGDRTALETLFTRHEAALLRLCRGMLAASHPADAEDAVQETLLRALRALAKPGGFRGEASVRTWLHRIAVNVCLEWRRSQRPALSLSSLVEEPIAATTADPASTTFNRLRLAEAFRSLPPRYRALLLLREQEEWSVTEIAALLNWNEKKVHNELFKARRILARWREGEDNG